MAVRDNLGRGFEFAPVRRSGRIPRMLPWCLVGAWIVMAPVMAFGEEFNHLPWELRPHYEFTMDRSVLRYAGDNARWDLRYEGLGDLFDATGFTIRLANGTDLGVADFDKGKSGRDRGESNQGPGVHYFVNLPSKHGLTVRHSFFVNTNFPFYTITMDVENTGTEPVEIARIEPIVFAPGSLARLSAQTEYVERALTPRGRWPMFSPDAPPFSVHVHDPENDVTLFIGLVPDGVARTTPRLFRAGEGWQGGVICEYSPAVTLQPGESLRTDPVWICFGRPSRDEVETLFVWTHSEEPKPAGLFDLPDAWVTVPASSTARQLQDAMTAWAPLGIRHALVPGGWEGRPGSLEGAAPGFPKEMSRLASAIRGSGGVPGLTLDPLVGDGGDTAWSALADDGIHWLNPAHPQGYARILNRMRAVATWGYAFYVVEPSTIPDAVLRHFNITRHQADTLGIAATQEAMGTAPVLPSPMASLGNNGPLWDRAVQGAQRMKEYQLAIGPVRLDISAGGYDAVVLESVKEFGGPIEVVGAPPASVARIIKGVFPRRGGTHAVPATWQSTPPAPESFTFAEEDSGTALEPAESAGSGNSERGFLRNIRARITGN